MRRSTSTVGYSALPESWLQGDGPPVGVASFSDRAATDPAATDPAASDLAATDPARGGPVPRYRVALVHGECLSPVGALLVEEIAAFFASR
jgi:hypothetical protein